MAERLCLSEGELLLIVEAVPHGSAIPKIIPLTLSQTCNSLARVVNDSSYPNEHRPREQANEITTPDWLVQS